MDITLLDRIPSISLPLPLYESHSIAQAVNGTERFDVVVGLNQQMVDALRVYALDETDRDLQTFSDDRQRFGSRASYQAWYASERVPFGLIYEPTKQLAALVWLGKKNPSVNAGADHWVTLGYRSYPPFRGTGIMTDFVMFAINYYKQHEPTARLWLSFDDRNTASQGLAVKLGFKIDEQLSNHAAHSSVAVKR